MQRVQCLAEIFHSGNKLALLHLVGFSGASCLCDGTARCDLKIMASRCNCMQPLASMEMNIDSEATASALCQHVLGLILAFPLRSCCTRPSFLLDEQRCGLATIAIPPGFGVLRDCDVTSAKKIWFCRCFVLCHIQLYHNILLIVLFPSSCESSCRPFCTSGFDQHIHAQVALGSPVIITIMTPATRTTNDPSDSGGFNLNPLTFLSRAARGRDNLNAERETLSFEEATMDVSNLAEFAQLQATLLEASKGITENTDAEYRR